MVSLGGKRDKGEAFSPSGGVRNGDATTLSSDGSSSDSRLRSLSEKILKPSPTGSSRRIETGKPIKSPGQEDEKVGGVFQRFRKEMLRLAKSSSRKDDPQMQDYSCQLQKELLQQIPSRVRGVEISEDFVPIIEALDALTDPMSVTDSVTVKARENFNEIMKRLDQAQEDADFESVEKIIIEFGKNLQGPCFALFTKEGEDIPIKIEE